MQVRYVVPKDDPAPTEHVKTPLPAASQKKLAYPLHSAVKTVGANDVRDIRVGCPHRFRRHLRSKRHFNRVGSVFKGDRAPEDAAFYEEVSFSLPMNLSFQSFSHTGSLG